MIEFGRRVIDAEIQALQTLRGTLDRTFEDAVEMILTATSHIIVTGVGKSGHIGGKIASSLASTGTPAFFMHPVEASHGDLGMVTPGSVILAISNSGETQELRDVLVYAKSAALPIIAITRNAKATLAHMASTVLLLPDVAEAGPGGLAPTSSTTCALALGDALTLAVMEARGFSSEEFGARHPGGQLGLQLQTVADWLAGRQDPLPLVQTTDTMRTVISVIASGQMGCAGVVDAEGCFQGMITDGDLRRAMTDDMFAKTAQDVMTREPATLTRDMRLGDVGRLMRDRRISNAFIVEDGRPLGAVHMKDLLDRGVF